MRRLILTLNLMGFLSPRVSVADQVKTVKLCDQTVATLAVSTSGTVLDFPIEPEKVILGTKGSFNVEFIKNDLVISPRIMGGKSNLFVYLFGRRFVFDLRSTGLGSTIVFIKDCESQVENPKKVSKKNGR